MIALALVSFDTNFACQLRVFGVVLRLYDWLQSLICWTGLL